MKQPSRKILTSRPPFFSLSPSLKAVQVGVKQPEASVMLVINSHPDEQRNQSTCQGTLRLYCVVVLTPAASTLFNCRGVGQEAQLLEQTLTSFQLSQQSSGTE